jgi:hypothetical protein
LFLGRAGADEVPAALRLELGPFKGGVPSSVQTLQFEGSALGKTRVLDAQDGESHLVWGMPLLELVGRLKKPKGADLLVLSFDNGMVVRVPLAARGELRALFVAFAHRDARGVYGVDYPLVGGRIIPCPKLVYQRPGSAYAIWHYTSQLTSIRLADASAYEAVLLQPTRQPPAQPGWKLYLQHCQACHGMGGEGAKRAPDFIGDLAAYRRIPPLAETDLSEQPSLHEKVDGSVVGDMPSLEHIPKRDIVEIWRWLHKVHRGATR